MERADREDVSDYSDLEGTAQEPGEADHEDQEGFSDGCVRCEVIPAVDKYGSRLPVVEDEQQQLAHEPVELDVWLKAGGEAHEPVHVGTQPVDVQPRPELVQYHQYISPIVVGHCEYSQTQYVVHDYLLYIRAIVPETASNRASCPSTALLVCTCQHACT